MGELETNAVRWQFGGGDVWSPDGAEADVLFGSARSAIEHLAEAAGVQLVEAVCRCATGDDCD